MSLTIEHIIRSVRNTIKIVIGKEGFLREGYLYIMLLDTPSNTYIFTNPHCKCYNTAIHMNPGAAFAARFSAFRFYVDFLIHAIKTWFYKIHPLRLSLHSHGYSPFHVKSYQTL